MYSVSNEFSKAIKADSRSVLYRVTLAGAVVADQTRIPKMVITESVGDTSGVSIGTANSSSLTFTLRKAETINYSDMLVEPESGLVLPDGSIEWIPLGKFWVTDFQTSNDYETVNLSCADGMYHLTDEFVSELTYPTSIKNVMTEFTAKTGVTFVSSLPDLEIRVKPEGMTCREAAGHLAGCCGKNARFDREGNLEFFWYEENGVTIEREHQYLNGMTKLNDKPLDVSFEVIGKQEKYTVTCVTDGNGGMTATPGQNVLEGDTVVVSINPFYGYELAAISAVTDAGDSVTLFMDSEGGRTFVQPDSNVTVTAAFRANAIGPFNLTLRTDDNGSINSDEFVYEEGDEAIIYIEPNDGYELDKFTTIPAGITLGNVGENTYMLTFPKSDVTVTVSYKEIAVKHSISATVDVSVFEHPGYVYVENTFTGELPLRHAPAGTNVSVTYSPESGYELDRIESSVTLTQVASSTYTFTMPDEDVTIVVHYKLSEDTSKTGKYSWLALPTYNTPPTSKPYWAVLYKDDWSVPTCKKFYLVWFDSWSASGYNTDGGKRIYTVNIDGYYYCGSQDTGHLPHAWDTSVWSGNGASGSTLTWDIYVDGHAWSGSGASSPSGDYCLLASNVHLFQGSSLLFEKCENAIQFPRTSYLVDGVDVREQGSLTHWKCPDTFSTPLPAKKWMIVNADGSLCMTPRENGTGYSSSDYCDGLYVVFFDNIVIENIGAVFDNSDEEFYVATLTNGHYTALKRESSTTSWTAHDVADGEVIGLRSPLHGCNGTSDMLGIYYFSGILATNVDLWSSGLFMYRNDSRICDCATTAEAEPVVMYSVRRTSSASNADAESVTIEYENPLIYEKMVDTVSSLVQGVTYTPAKVKHRGNPAFQVGDIIRTPDKNGVYHTVIIMQQTMNFGGGMNSEITCPGKTEKNKKFSSGGPLTSQIKKEVGVANFELERKIASNNALVYAALYKTIGQTESKIASVVEWQTEKSATIAKTESLAKANEANIQSLTKWQGETNDSLATIEQKAAKNEASIELLSKWQDETITSVADITQKVSDNEANIKTLTDWQGDVNESIATIEQTASEQGANISLTAQYVGLEGCVGVENTDGKSTWDKTKIYHVLSANKYYAWCTTDGEITATTSGNKLTLSSVTVKSATNRMLSIALSDGVVAMPHGHTIGIVSKSSWVEINPPVCGTIETLQSSLAEIQAASDEQGASIKMLTEWKGETNNALASIEQKVTENEANIGLVVKSGSVQAGILMQAINDDESSIKISADKLDIFGEVLDIKVKSTNIDGLIYADSIMSIGDYGSTSIDGGSLESRNKDATKIVEAIQGSLHIRNANESARIFATFFSGANTYTLYVYDNGSDDPQLKIMKTVAGG